MDQVDLLRFGMVIPCFHSRDSCTLMTQLIAPPFDHYYDFKSLLSILHLRQACNIIPLSVNLYECIKEEFSKVMGSAVSMSQLRASYLSGDVAILSYMYQFISLIKEFEGRCVRAMYGEYSIVKFIDFVHLPYLDCVFYLGETMREQYAKIFNRDLQFFDSPAVYISPMLLGGPSLNIEETLRQTLLREDNVTTCGFDTRMVIPRIDEFGVCSAEVAELFPNISLNVQSTTALLEPLLKNLFDTHEEQFKLIELEKKLKVEFSINKKHLISAITHPSFAYSRGFKTHFERLEYLGDSVLSLMATTYYYEHLKTAPFSTLCVSSMSHTTNETLKEISQIDLELDKYVKVDFENSPKKLHGVRDKIISDVFESILGAILLDRGLESCRYFLSTHLHMKCHEQEVIHSYQWLRMNQKRHSPSLWKKLENVEQLLGFEFNDRYILLEALTHPTGYSIVKQELKIDPNIPQAEFNFQRFKVLGESILKFVIASHVFFTYPARDEGCLTRLAIEYIKNESMVKVANQMELSKCIISSQISESKTTIDCLKALIGAIYLDKGGIFETIGNVRKFDVFHSFIHKNIIEPLGELDPDNLNQNPRMLITSISNLLFKSDLVYETKKVSGKYQKSKEKFEFKETKLSLKKSGTIVAVGCARKKKESEVDACNKAIQFFVNLLNRVEIDYLTIESLPEYIDKYKFPYQLESDPFTLAEIGIFKCEICRKISKSRDEHMNHAH